MAIRKIYRASDPTLEAQIDEIIKHNHDDVYALKSVVQGILDELLPVGLPRDWPWNDLPPGRWLWMDGRTIGNALSNATARANFDVQKLFVKIWTDYNDTTAPIYKSDGSLSTRGDSAIADWDANKQITILDRRGRTLVGMDNMTDVSANVITATWADVLGGIGGTEKVQLSVSNMPSHNHEGLTGNDSPDHVHSYTHPDRNVQGYGVAPAAWDWAAIVSANTDGASARHKHSISSQGSNVAHDNIQPSVATKWIIRY